MGKRERTARLDRRTWSRLFNKRRAQVGIFWRQFSGNRLAVISLVILIVLNVLALITPYVARFPARMTAVAPAFQSPSLEYPMGTDNMGRDILSDMLWGSRTDLLVAYLSVLIASTIGIFIGSMAGFFGSWIDVLLSRFTEFFLVIPPIFLAMVLVAMFGSNLLVIVFAIGVTSWSSTARLTRAEFLSIRDRGFVEASKAIGLHPLIIMFGEILPNALGPIIVNGTLQFASAILIEAMMGFFGLSDPQVVSWGEMLYRAVPFLQRAWWLAFWPGLAITCTALAFNLAGEGLHDVLCPKLRREA